MSVPFIEQEIREQPAVLRRVLESTRRDLERLIEPRRSPRMHLVGCGDMHFAAQAVAWLASLHLTMDARAWRSMDVRWAAAGWGGDDLVICASVSGRTPRTVEAAQIAHRVGARVVGLSDSADSPLADAVEGLALLHTSPPDALGEGPYPGYHHQIGQTKTFAAVLLAEILSAAMSAGRPLPLVDEVPSRLEAVLPGWLEEITAAAPAWFARRSRVMLLASGPHLPLARYGAAKFLEYAVPAQAQCLEEFNHLEVFIANQKTLAVVLAPDAPSAQRASELLEPWEGVGMRSVVIGPPREWPGARTASIHYPNLHPATSLFLQTVALQLIAYRGAVALGRDPDRWLGGLRTELLNATSLRTVRGSRIEPEVHRPLRPERKGEP